MMAALPAWLTLLIAPFIVLNVVIGLVTYVTLLERKFAARMQSRIGPYRVGPHGLLQPIADALKLMMKEDVVPTAADRRIYNLAPIVFLVSLTIALTVLAGPVSSMTMRAAEQLLDRNTYVHAVLGEGVPRAAR